ncbi:XRE family transcriptional regulator [Actinosynnema sp. NPDC020468]|uniref:nSTAND1 domain-containing NTPase n=1 Tax=Actinosynnema sp. NPDC020468 TaxID=3154488 RepID=UPI0033F8D94B
MPRGERPLDVGDSPLLKFAADLRSLRDKAGGHSYRQLGARAHYSATTLSDAAGGRKLPTLAVTLAYVRACEGDVIEWEDRWHRVAAEVAPPEPTTEDAHPPYAGLAAFQPEDAEWFFGRDRVLEDLDARIAARRFVGVFGASGAGKSSLLRAGLVPRFAGRTVVTTPSESGVRSDLLDLTCDLLIVDQFEEVFTLCPDAEQRAEYIDTLLDATCRVVVGVRADFYGHCAAHPRLVEALTDGQLLLGPMGPEELRQAIMQPAVKASCTVETALVSRLIADATGQAGVLPLMSHALLETWRRRRGTTLTLPGYEAAGGVQHAIAQTAERTYTSLEKQQRALARQVFLRLTSLGDGTEDTKRRVPRTELDPDVDVDVVLDRLAHARLLSLDRDSVEIAHEALIRSWPRLRGWLADDRDALRTMRQLTEAAATWDSLARDPDALYRGTRLDTAVEWAHRDGVRTSARERDFLADSLAARDRERKTAHRRTRRLRQLVALLLVLLVFASGAVVLAIRAQKTVAEERNRSVAWYVASGAQSKRDSDPHLANQLAIVAYRLSPTDDLRDGVLSAYAAESHDMVSRSAFTSGAASSPDGRPRPDGRVPTEADDRVYVRLGSRTDPRDSVTSSVVAGGERAFATTVEGYTGRIWDITDAIKPSVAHTFPTPLTTLGFSPDGHLAVTVSAANETAVWDTSTPSKPVELSRLLGQQQMVTGLAWAVTGQVLATFDTSGLVRLWDLTSAAEPRRVGEFAAGPDVTALALSSDLRTIAVGYANGVLRVKDLTNPYAPRDIQSVEAHTDSVRALAFRRGGTSLVSVGRDDSVRMWDMVNRGPVPRAKITGRTTGIYGVSFAETADKVTTSNADGTSRSWEFDFDVVVSAMCQAVETPISREEWQRYVGGLAFRPPCP